MNDKGITRISTVIQHGSLMPISFAEREKYIKRGVLVYLNSLLGEYLSDDQITSLTEMLHDIRVRPAEVEFDSSLCRIISLESEIHNRYIPRKLLRKDEAAVILYNLAPYAMINRTQTATMAKLCFPNFFASAATINSTFTKFQNTHRILDESHLSLTIEGLFVRTTEELEVLLIELALRQDLN